MIFMILPLRQTATYKY